LLFFFFQVSPAPSGAPQAISQGLSALTHPHTQISEQEPRGPSRLELSEDAALKMAIDASLRTASEEGVLRLTYPDGGDEAGPSRVSESSIPSEVTAAAPIEEPPPAAAASSSTASAPPLPIHYPAIDTSPVVIDTLTVSHPKQKPLDQQHPRPVRRREASALCAGMPQRKVCAFLAVIWQVAWNVCHKLKPRIGVAPFAGPLLTKSLEFILCSTRYLRPCGVVSRATSNKLFIVSAHQGRDYGNALFLRSYLELRTWTVK
jgi:hypothetical protein